MTQALLFNLTHDDMMRIADEIIWGGKFKVIYYPSAVKSKTMLDDKIDLLQAVNFTQPVSG